MELAALQPPRQRVPLVEVLAVDGHAHLLRSAATEISGGWRSVRFSPGIFEVDHDVLMFI